MPPRLGTAAVPTLPLRADVLLSNDLFEELDDGISVSFLQHCTGQEDLDQVDFVELQVDAVGGSQRVEKIGELLPNLQQLRLNQSSICTVRDLGTSLSRLKVLWLCRSSLQDLGGITAMPLLEELYVSFNDIRELSPLCTHESLQVLDLEGNLVEDLEEVRALQAISSLRELTLSLNPLWRIAGMSREKVLDALPQLQVLDDTPRGAPEQGPGLDISGLDMGMGFSLGMGRDSDVDGDGDYDHCQGPCVDAAELLTDVPLVPEGPPMIFEDSQALRKLRERAGPGAGPRTPAPSPAAAQQLLSPSARLALAFTEERVGQGQKPTHWESPRSPPAGAGPGARTPTGTGSTAVAALQAERARLRAAVSARGEQRDVPPSGAGPGLGSTEPSEQDLVVERLKRATRPMPSTWRYQSASARPAEGGRGRHAFLPDRRPMTAWSSGRPTTASSGTGAVSSRSAALSSLNNEPDAAASDLTTGDDGTSLAGNPLSAVRRRRRAAAAQGEDEMSIWNLLRRGEAEVTSCSDSSVLAAGHRVATPDVRIGPSRILTAGQGQSMGVAGPVRTPARRPKTPGDSLPTDVPAPSLATGSAEVLFIE